MTTSEDWSNNGWQETPPVDAQVEDREKGTSLFFLHCQKEYTGIQAASKTEGAASRTEGKSNPNLLIIELVSAEGSDARFDATCAQGNEEEPHHGQHAVCEEEHLA